MIDINNLCFGQRFDPELGILQPWFVHGALDRIMQMDLSDKKVLEFGGGSSSLYWAMKCKEVYTIDTNPDWAANIQDTINQHGLSSKFRLELRQVNEGDQSRVEEYIKIPEGFEPDIIVNDGILRTEVCQLAIDYFTKKGGGTLICDNWYQAWVWLSPKAVEIMSPYESEIYEQADHTDNDGVNKWKTAIFYIK